jgi:pimeloyl-ACP methyl ester carboxylesterase
MMMKKIFKVVGYVAAFLLIVILGLLISLWIDSPGKAEPITGIDGKVVPGSISTIEKVILGGVEQHLIIRGVDSIKPVMLFLHGGPGSPEYAFLKQTNRAIENDFVMVYWEQRGAGKSYSKSIPPESMNLEQFISDAKELSQILIERFGKEKIYIMGHSWGSFFGILTANRYPDLFHAYIGVGQVANQYKGEQISFEWAKEQANKLGDEDAIKTLSEMTFPDLSADSKTWLDFLMVERNYVTKFGGGVTHEMTSMLPVLTMVLETKEYTVKDKVSFVSGSLFSLKNLWPDVVDKNLSSVIDSMQVPVYIFQGVYDYQTPYSVAKEFFDQLKAPKKEFFTFENSAHSPVMEEVDKFNSILIEKVVVIPNYDY